MRQIWEGWKDLWIFSKILTVFMFVMFVASLLLWIYLIGFVVIHLIKL